MDHKEYFKKHPATFANAPYCDTGRLILDARLMSGLTQEKLAKKMGIAQPSVARAERGRQEASLSFLKRVADASGLHLVLPRMEKKVDKRFSSTDTITGYFNFTNNNT